MTQLHEGAAQALKDLYDSVEQYLLHLGDDVTRIVNKNYYVFRRLKNFACVEVHPQKQRLLVYLKVDPDTVTLRKGFSRDVRSIGHFGTGDSSSRSGCTRTSPRRNRCSRGAMKRVDGYRPARSAE